MNRTLLLLLTITGTANSAAQFALNRPAFGMISGILALLALASWVASAKDDKKPLT